MHGALISVSEPQTAADVIANARIIRKRMHREEEKARLDQSIALARRISEQVAALEKKKNQRSVVLYQSVAGFKQRILDAAVKHYKVTDIIALPDGVIEVEARKWRVCYPAPIGPTFNAEDIIGFAAREFLLEPRDLIGPWRGVVPVRARQCAMWVMRRRRFMSLPEIGRKLGGRDHTTVLHAVRTIDREIKERGLVGISVVDLVRAFGEIYTAKLRQ